jgi:hypothetical protein
MRISHCRTTLGTLGLVTMLGLAACGQGGPDIDEAPPEDATQDELLAEVGRRVPGFGGMYVDDLGQMQVYVAADAPLAEGRPETLRAALRAVLGEAQVPERIEVVRGRYGFAQLRGWHERVWREVLAMPGAVLTDIDEAHNRVRIGIEPGMRAERIVDLLGRAGLPDDAVAFEEMEPIRELVTLQQSVRPLAGGLQIAFSNFVCTLGFNVTRGGVGGFVTNSHCTDVRGVVTPTQYYQPTRTTANHIGTEAVDPPFFTGAGCPAGRRCRYSDTAFVRRDAGVSATLGSVERTTALGSLTIAGTYRVVTEGAVAVNTTLNKVGRTTGWTRGPATSTCANVGVSGSTTVMLCQGLVTAGVGGGDSGSPVFQVLNSPAQNDVRLVGILWGGGGGQFVYSPIANIQRTGEMGALTNCAAGFSC